MLVIILAAGKGTRMKSDTPKVMFDVAGKKMLAYSIENAKKLNPDKIIVITGHGSSIVEEAFYGQDIIFCKQKEQLGTANAVLAATKYIKDYKGNVLILSADMPAVQPETLKNFISYAVKQNTVCFISTIQKNPKGYGRVVRTAHDDILQIVEEKDANATEKLIKEVNAGIYYCEANLLLRRLTSIGNKNAQGEYYLTDIITTGSKAYIAENSTEFTGINDRAQLAEVSKQLYKIRAFEHMRAGVSIIDPDTVYISPEALITEDTTIYPNVYIEGACNVGKSNIIRQGVRLVNSTTENNCEIKDNSLIEDSFIGENSSVGPMAHLRPGSILKGNNKVGNFVEVKKSLLEQGVKAGHLTYLGDSHIGKNTNIGCGTITCNYDGFKKHKTVVGENVFVGSGTELVAPVTVGDNALIGAGSTITKDVPENDLALSRHPQTNIKNGAKKIRNKKGEI